MRIMERVLAILVTMSIMICCTISVSASTNVASYIAVSAGGSAYSSETSTKTSYTYSYYISLRWFKFPYYPESCMPGGCHIYARLCEELTKNPIGGILSFTAPTSVGNYIITYPSGYGNIGESYLLKTHSSYTLAGYEAIFDWSADA